MSPASDAGASSTPLRPNSQVHGSGQLKSTPSSRGAATISENIGLVGVTVRKLSPWIERDVEQTKECPVDFMLQALLQRGSCDPDTIQPKLLDQCLEAVLPVCNGTVSTALGNSSEIATILNDYGKPGVEDNFYSPFIKLTNIALACLAETKVDGMCDADPDVDMICQKNDMPMQQTHQTRKSTRKPDLVMLPLNSACAPFETNNKDTAKGGKKDTKKRDKKDAEKGGEKDAKTRDEKRKAHMDKNAMESPKNLPWKDILACIEVKRDERKRKVQMTVPNEHVVKDYAPTTPEYLSVDHPKVEGASQTPATQSLSVAASAVPPSGSTTARPSKGKSKKRPSEDTLESATRKKNKTGNQNWNDDADLDPDAEVDVTVQMGLYAAEMFAANLGVNHMLNFIVVDDVIRIWYYDRQGIIQCSGINFLQDLPRFMVLLYALQRFKLEDWGRNEAFLPSEEKQCHELHIKDENLGTVDLQLKTSDSARVRHYGLQGRATNVIPVTSDTLAEKYPHIPKNEMVAKIFWGEASRTSEPEILKKVKEIAEVNPDVKDHIPELLWHHTFTNPTSAIREALRMQEPTKGSRVLYILVFRKLNHITELHGIKFFDVWQQCIKCHVALWKGGVYHRDVSPGNMMWYEKDGKLIGVLNDYDLSSLASDRGPRGNERTGTIPFMAIDLLTAKGQRGEVKHMYRHDMESFVWVFIWVCLRYREGALLETGKRPLDKWATKSAMECGQMKYWFLRDFENYYPKDIEKPMRFFIVDCVEILQEDSKDRTSRRNQLLKSEETKQSDDEGPEDIDGFLLKFTSKSTWKDLIKLINPPQ